jgi:hypothetical protein
MLYVLMGFTVANWGANRTSSSLRVEHWYCTVLGLNYWCKLLLCVLCSWAEGLKLFAASSGLVGRLGCMGRLKLQA